MNQANSVNLKIVALLLALCAMRFFGSEVHAMQKPRHIVLLGASVGEAWKIEYLPDRLMKSDSSPLTPDALLLKAFPYRFEYVGEYQFDKSKALQQVLQRKENRPDAVLLKECAAYFPGDLANYRNLIKMWVGDCLRKGVMPILVSVAPVRGPSFWKLQYWKNLVKRIVYPNKSTVEARLRELTAFNDWIRKYALEQNLQVLDLEKALRVSGTDRHLKVDLDGGDGLHLNQKAYSILDQIILPTLAQAFRNDKIKK